MDRGAWRTTVPGITKSQSDGQRETDTLPPKRTRTHTHPKEPKAGFSVLLLFVVVVGSRRSKGAEP